MASLRRHSALKPGKPLKRKTRLRQRNPERAARQRLRCFGPQAEWLRDMRCCTCGAPPPSEPSHVKSRGAGGLAEDQVPQCADCHRDYHRGSGEYQKMLVESLKWLAADYARSWLHQSQAVREKYEMLFKERWPEAGKLMEGATT